MNIVNLFSGPNVSELPGTHHKESLAYWVALSCISTMGPQTFYKLQNTYPDLADLFKLFFSDLKALGLKDEVCQAIQNPDWQRVETILQSATQQADLSIISISDPCYPPRLREIHTPPPLLYCRGNISHLIRPQLAIVGSRNPTATGCENAKQFAFLLAKQGLTITSGLALGIDAASHRGALMAMEEGGGSQKDVGSTVVVTATGWDCVYPKQHVSLANEIVANDGVIVTEFPPGTLPIQQNFPQRNRLLSGLSLGVLVVEAALKSGSLITARFALEQNREVFAIPGSIHNPLARGCHALIRQGAKLVEAASDVWEEIQGVQMDTNLAPCAKKGYNQRPIQINTMQKKSGLSKKHTQLLAFLGHEVTSMEVLLCRSGLTSGVISSMLLDLELRGMVACVPGGYIRTVRV